MDWLLEVHDKLAEQVYWQVADLLNLEVDLLFFDTTSTYFETEQAELTPDGAGATVGFRAYGKSKDHRPDLPQVVIGMAVTRTGIPIRVWCWPGDTGDSPLIRRVRDDLRAWKLSRVVWIADRGLSSAENRRYLQPAGGRHIIGEKLRGDPPRRPPRRPAKAATTSSRATCGSTRSSSTTEPCATGSWSVTTPSRPAATPSSATRWSPSCPP